MMQIQLVQLTVPHLWQRLEFGIVVMNGPAIANPFDPDLFSLDATFTLPSGATMVVPVFWYQAYQRVLSGTNEVDTAITDPATVSPGWHLRFTPPMSGNFTLSFVATINNQVVNQAVPIVLPNGSTSNSTTFNVPPGQPRPKGMPGPHGYIRIPPHGRYFETGEGQGLPLIGHNVCWPGSDGGKITSAMAPNEGTFNYDRYFVHMTKNGENYARIWMCPFGFGIEPAGKWIYAPSTKQVTLYSLQIAWQLDYILQRAEQSRIYLLFCLDYHGMFDPAVDWPNSPYNSANGGLCNTPNDFFTDPNVQTIYQKRLRYLVARYGYSQNLLAWEFLNEIDNVYNTASLDPAAVAAWHGVMGNWLHAHDPFHHLRTTSLTGGSTTLQGGSTPATIWKSLDFTTYHSYNEPAPAARLATVASELLHAYGKPVIIGEFGTSNATFPDANDPYLRGFRQGIWGGALSGSVGTAMSWYWQEIETENYYSVYLAVYEFFRGTGWGSGVWNPIVFGGTSNPSAIGLRDTNNKSLLYVVAPGVAFSPGSPGTTAPPSSLPMIHGQTIILLDWPAGTFTAKWVDPATGQSRGSTQAVTAPNGSLTLPLPDFKEDLAATLTP